MSFHDSAYSAFMLDYAAGVLAPAERLVADLHRVLSRVGAKNALLLESMGGAILEGVVPADGTPPPRLGPQDHVFETSTRFDRYLKRDLVALKWRKSIFGVKTLPTDVPMASLLRLDPGERAPGHCHGRRDVTVVLQGSYADEFGVYERGDLAFAEPGMRHEPRAVGGEICVCLLAEEAGRPLLGFFGLFGVGIKRQKDAA
ncbi:MAG: cupin domain-containing protein [Hyphomonadaceae bacterium]|nr:cupin domain-containing protein [Hyphomonadaceae bacterium]